MDTKSIYSNLCNYDKRNPESTVETYEEAIPRTNCHCDNCFYGRDKLALEIISLNELLNKGEKRS